MVDSGDNQIFETREEFAQARCVRKTPIEWDSDATKLNDEPLDEMYKHFTHWQRRRPHSPAGFSPQALGRTRRAAGGKYK